MKTIFLSVIILGVITFSACKNDSKRFEICEAHLKNCPISEDCPEHPICEAHEKCAKDMDCKEHPDCEAFEHR